jgi:D-sedoheptulose 7-phosphate isomerase
MNHTTPCAQQHLQELIVAAQSFEDCVDVADRWGTRLASVLERGGRLLAAGNGGSSAQAQHLTAELVGRYRDDRPPYSAICLSSETSTMTALSNDYPPDQLFARQVLAHGRPGDVLVLLSTSGRSANILSAARQGRACGLQVWAFTGPPGNPLSRVADESLCVEARFTATVQELHLVGLHILCAGLDRQLGVIPAQTPAGVEVVSGMPT